MELKQFITEVLTQIAEGTMGAAKVFTDNGGMINPKVAGYKGNAQTARVSNNKNAPDSILCDVRFSATLSENISETGRKGIGVQFGIINAGGGKGSETNQSALTQVEFTIPVVLPDVAGARNSPDRINISYQTAEPW